MKKPDPMNCYRATFNRELKCNYWEKKGVEGITFKEVHAKMWPMLREIYAQIRALGVTYVWHFYEPFVEMTWITNPENNKKIKKIIKDACKKNKINDCKFENGHPAKGFKPDWFCNNEGEMKFGAARHALSAQMVEAIETSRPWIEAGLGIEEQISRNIHTICNPMGLNYRDEGKICFSRGLMCYLYWYLPAKVARFLYVKVFRQKLPK